MKRHKWLRGLLACLTVSLGISASGIIWKDQKPEDGTLILPSGYLLPTWCLVFIDPPGGFMQEPDRYGCDVYSGDPLKYNWALVGFPEDDDDHSDNDRMDNSRDICPTITGNSGLWDYGCPWQYWDALRRDSILDPSTYDYDDDGVLVWHDLCQGEQGTSATLGCETPPDSLCDAMEHLQGIFQGDYVTGYLEEDKWYYWFHEGGASDTVFGMGPKAITKVNQACESGSF